MTTSPGMALRRLRGNLSLRSFAALLVAHGLPPGTLSRQRLSQVEAGAAELPPELWAAIRLALRAAGHSDDETALLVVAPPPIITPAAESTPATRRKQWQRLLEAIPGNRWWQPPTTIAAKVLGDDWIETYQTLAERYDIDVERHRHEVLRRLAMDKTWTADPHDRVTVHRDDIDQTLRIGPGDPFVVTARLHNAGTATWTHRMLYRLGPPVSSSLPFAPVLVPLPDTEPGCTAMVVISGRGQVFPNLAVMTYTMVFADCSPCLPGATQFFVDTRNKHKIDQTISLPTRS